MYQNAYISRLSQKNRILMLKKQQLQHINKMHQYHQFTQNQQKKVNQNMYKNLANQYKHQIEENIRKKSNQKSLERIRDKDLLEKNQQVIKQKQHQKQLIRKNIAKYNLLNNVQINNTNRLSQTKEKQTNRSSHLQFIQNSKKQPNQKTVSYNQYYDQLAMRNRNLQSIYRNSTQPVNISKISRINEIQTKKQKQYVQNLQKAHQTKQEKIKADNQNLKKYLELQINKKMEEKNRNRQYKLEEDINRTSNQVNSSQQIIKQRQRSRYEQYLYSKELAKQYNQQLSVQRQNSKRSHEHTYLNASSDLISNRKDVNSPDSPKSGILLGNQKYRPKQHNPILNPIPFSIGITNPYILKQYENKRKSTSFKGSNLAQLGDQSFRNN